jgi:Spy/CpxP family protein refolding chaperone
MNKAIFFLTGLMAFVGPAKVMAADEHADMAAMMESHMNNPVHREVMAIYGLPEMQSQLGLSAQQVADLQRLKKQLLTKSDDLSAQIASRRKELDTLLATDNAKPATVKSLFEKIASQHAELHYAGFETANKMKAVLTSEQRTKFDAMKPMEVHHVVMSSAKMADVEQTLQRLGFEEGSGMKMEMKMDKGDQAESKGGMGKMGMMDKMGMHGMGGDATNKDASTKDAAPADHSAHDHH